MSGARKHLATRWHISSSSGGGSILRCYCGDWESNPKETTYAQRDAHRAHRVEMGETVAPPRPSASDRLKAAEAAIARVREVHDVHSCERDGHIHRSTPNPCVNNGFCMCGQRDPCPTLTALDPPEFELIEMTHEEWETARDNSLTKLGCTLEALQEMARTGDYATPNHRALWLAIKPVPPETPR